MYRFIVVGLPVTSKPLSEKHTQQKLASPPRQKIIVPLTIGAAALAVVITIGIILLLVQSRRRKSREQNGNCRLDVDEQVDANLNRKNMAMKCNGPAQSGSVKFSSSSAAPLLHSDRLISGSESMWSSIYRPKSPLSLTSQDAKGSALFIHLFFC